MTPEEITDYICKNFSGVIPKNSWGEISLFYNPEGVLPNGVYFCTIKQHDGENDRASNLDRQGVFRVAIGLTSETYVKLFGQKPARPGKGGVVATGHDFTKLNELMPHPVYAWMSWAQILCPSQAQFENILYLIEESYKAAANKFDKRHKRSSR